MKQQPSPRMVWRFVLTLGMSLSALLQLFPVRASTAQEEGAGRDRQLRQAETITSLPAKAKRWALVIGVDRYRDGNISPLRGAADDAGTLANALTQYAGFPPDQVVLLATDQPEERQPTRINILAYLSNLASAAPKDGLLLVSFAGHGIERGGQAYLIPSDARLTNDVSLLEESAISVERMHNRIRAANVAQVMILLDACRNDPGGRADAPNPLTEAYTRGFNFDVRNREVQAFATLYATAVGQRAYEYQEKKQGYFTWAIVEGMKGGAANERGEVTLARLVGYVQDVVPKRIAIDLGAGKQQRPFAVIEGYRADELVVAVAAPTGASNTPARPDLTLKDAGTVEAEYWESIKNSSDAIDFQDYLKEYPQGRYAPLARVKLRQLEAKRDRPNDKSDTAAAPPTQKTAPSSRAVGAFTITLNSCKMYGDEVTCELTVNNDSAESKNFSLVREDYRARRRGQDVTKAVDTSGNEYAVSEPGFGAAKFRHTLTPNVPEKFSIKFKGVPRETASFSLLRVAVSENTNRVQLSYADFRNVPFIFR